MTAKTATAVRPRLVQGARADKLANASHVRAGVTPIDDCGAMFDLMLADMDTRLAAIEQRTDRIAALAA